MRPVWAVVQPLGPGAGHGGPSTAMGAMVWPAGALLWQVGPYRNPWVSAVRGGTTADRGALVRLVGAPLGLSELQ